MSPGRKTACCLQWAQACSCAEFQSVALPNGLIANLYGSVEGRRHDAGMLRDFGLLDTLEREAYSPRVEHIEYGERANGVVSSLAIFDT